LVPPSPGRRFRAIADWARQKKDWLADFLDLSSGIPSHDRFNAIFRALQPEQFERCLVAWITELHKGRRRRASGPHRWQDDAAELRQGDRQVGLHMVSAWATTNKISLGQVAVAEKSNEITAIPKLARSPGTVRGVVTIDAMGCQAEIAEKIVEKQATMSWPSKATSRPCMRDHRVLPGPDGGRLRPGEGEPSRDEREGARSGRAPDVLCVRRARRLAGCGARWKGLKRIGVAISDTVRSGKPCDDVRYYILSRRMSARSFGAAVRGHWGIETRCTGSWT